MTILASASLHRSGLDQSAANYTLTVNVGNTIKGVDIILRDDMPEAVVMGSIAAALEVAAASLRISAKMLP